MYKCAIREPLVIRWPDKIKESGTSDYPVMETDFYPTLLSLEGITLKPKQRKDGINFKPILEGKVMLVHPFWYYPHYSGGLVGRLQRQPVLRTINVLSFSRT